MYDYDAASSARRITEPDKRAGVPGPRNLRSEFERDRAPLANIG